ncbi:major facilitator superfamily transporter [Grosmannia clavigera kw1407]|uniref:Major facilitator superfamily transporter n=1 Tax=Grosmannia clavigera (strain kw1407 / UAMH 11150) TaxID=655863 RepID=F0XCD8_GROCL|nr:major facilitator superfamily transporter [Grosmannia clavigera kw1407]EFX04279.1 major facilitator superfamily transporter [Grosmannia clavigera kw1407]
MSTTLAKEKGGAFSTVAHSSSLDSDAQSSTGGVPELGAPVNTKQFWFQKARNYDPNAIATQRSVFDDAETADKYQPRTDWENVHRFDPLFRWTWAEENRLVRKIDVRIMVWTCVMFMALELDRANISQALTDNFLKDLKMTTNDYNLGNTVFKLAFLCAELPSQLVSKWVGPDRWIPAQMTIWSIVAFSQFWITGRSSFLATRALLGMLQGGFIPDVILYLSYFYKHFEMSIRLSFFWTAMSIADIISALLAYGLLHMRGVQDRSGWRWMFLLEGLLTFVIGLLAFVLMPPGPCQTASWFRGRNGWFNEREQKIIVNRVIRDDPTKSSMHNREPITPRTLFKSLKDYDLWPLYTLGLVFQIPMTPPTQYLTLSLKGLGFNTFQTNLLTIPYTVGHIILMLLLTYLSEIWNELTLTAMIGQFWALPFLVWLYKGATVQTNRWTVYAMTTVLLAYPNAHPIQVGWNSRNSNAVRLRTVSAASYNMFVQAGAIIASNIYRKDDAPLYKRGDKNLVAITCMNIVLYLLAKTYYVWRNRQRAARWNAMSEEQRLHYLATTKDEGNKRLDFRFQH